MANTSYNLNIDRQLSQIGSGLWGPELRIRDTLINDDDHVFSWIRGPVYNDYRVTIGYAPGRAHVLSTRWLGDVDRLEVPNVPTVRFWFSLYARLGNGEPIRLDKLYTPQVSNAWDDDEYWDDSTVCTDA